MNLSQEDLQDIEDAEIISETVYPACSRCDLVTHPFDLEDGVCVDCRQWQDYSDAHADCEQCTGYSSFEADVFICSDCGEVYSDPEEASWCCEDDPLERCSNCKCAVNWFEPEFVDGICHRCTEEPA